MTKVFLKKREIDKGAMTVFAECLEWHEHFNIDKKNMRLDMLEEFVDFRS